MLPETMRVVLGKGWGSDYDLIVLLYIFRAWLSLNSMSCFLTFNVQVLTDIHIRKEISSNSILRLVR